MVEARPGSREFGSRSAGAANKQAHEKTYTRFVNRRKSGQRGTSGSVHFDSSFGVPALYAGAGETQEQFAPCFRGYGVQSAHPALDRPLDRERKREAAKPLPAFSLFSRQHLHVPTTDDRAKSGDEFGIL